MKYLVGPNFGARVVRKLVDADAAVGLATGLRGIAPRPPTRAAARPAAVLEHPAVIRRQMGALREPHCFAESLNILEKKGKPMGILEATRQPQRQQREQAP